MDFITKLPRTARGVNSTWFIVDRLTKSVYLILIAKSISIEKLDDIYIREALVWHGVPVFGGTLMRIWVLNYISV